MWQKIKCFLGLHENKDHSYLCWNPDWEYDGEIACIIKHAICKCCNKTSNYNFVTFYHHHFMFEPYDRCVEQINSIYENREG